MNCTVIIPTYRPGEETAAFIGRLLERRRGAVIIVDDGSGPGHGETYERFARAGGRVLRHESPKGKGACVRTALAGASTGEVRGGLVLFGYNPAPPWPVYEDALRHLERPGEFYLYMGGQGASSRLMRLLYGIDYGGQPIELATVPAGLAAGFTAGRTKDRDFDYSFLIWAHRQGLKAKRSTAPPAESGAPPLPGGRLRVMFQLLRGVLGFAKNALVAAVADLLIYTLMLRFVLAELPVARQLFIAALSARVVSSILNYSLNRRLPFTQNARVLPTIVRYYLLWSVELMASYGFVLLFKTLFGANAVLVKIPVDILIGFAGYQVQMRWVFKNRGAKGGGHFCQRPYNPAAHFIRFIYRLAHRKWRVRDAARRQRQNAGPAIYLVHHQNMAGPLHAMGLSKGQPRLWAYSRFFSPRECFDQFYGYTFTERFGWPKPLALCVAAAAAPVVPFLLRCFRCVPVYRGKGAVTTLRLTLGLLKQGHSVIICPDVDYTSSGSGVSSLYEGFLHLDKMYARAKNEHLPFVTMNCDRDKKLLYIGREVRFTAGDDFKREKKRVVQVLIQQMNAIGV